MSTIKRINHVAIVVDDIQSALSFWHDALGLELSHVENVPDEQAVVAFLPTQESEVELVKPTGEDMDPITVDLLEEFVGQMVSGDVENGHALFGSHP